MAKKDLKRLSRKELLEMLVEQGRELERLQRELSEAQEKLNDRQIRLKTAGTIAEAAFSLNGVYEAVDAAAKQYLETIETQSQAQKNSAAQLVADAQIEATSIRSGARRVASEIIEDAQAQKKRMLDEAQAEKKRLVEDAETYANYVYERVRALLREHPELQEQFEI